MPEPTAAPVEPAAASGGGGLWGSIRHGASVASGWAVRQVLEPLRRLWGAATRTVGQYGGAAVRGAASVRPRWADVLQPHLIGVRALVAAQRSVLSEAVVDERRARQAAVAASTAAPGQDPGPGPVERLDAAVGRMEALAEGPMGVADEVAQGAVLGDFQEDPSGWNTAGQIAMGFVPYAGQVADARDTVAAIRRLHRSGWKDAGAWGNLALTVVAWVPGIGDAVKGVGKGAARWLRKGAPALLRRGHELWTLVRHAAPRLLGGARAFGSRLLAGARRLGGTVGAAARTLGARAAATGRRLWSGARGLLTGTGGALTRLLGRARAAGARALSRGRALLGRAGSAVRALAGRVFGGAGSAVRAAVDRVRAVADRWRRTAAAIRRGVSERLAAARAWARGMAGALRTHAGSLLQRARAGAGAALRRAAAAARDLLRRGADRVRRFVTQDVPRLRARAVQAVRAGLRQVRDRLVGFLRRHVWERVRKPVLKGRELVDDLVRRLTRRGDPLSLVSEQRRRHILYGDATGGGHLWPGLPGKTSFPREWDAQKVLREVSDIATDPSAHWVQQTGVTGAKFTKAGAPVKWKVTAQRGGIDIAVIVQPDGVGIVSAFPVR